MIITYEIVPIFTHSPPPVHHIQLSVIKKYVCFRSEDSTFSHTWIYRQLQLHPGDLSLAPPPCSKDGSGQETPSAIVMQRQNLQTRNVFIVDQKTFSFVNKNSPPGSGHEYHVARLFWNRQVPKALKKKIKSFFLTQEDQFIPYNSYRREYPLFP